MRQVPLSAVIAAEASPAASAAMEVTGSFIVAIQADADFAGTALTAEASYDGGLTWAPVTDDAGAVPTVTIAASTTARLDASEWCFADLIRFVSNTTQPAATPSTLIVVVLAD